jgi:hypothetical protein
MCAFWLGSVGRVDDRYSSQQPHDPSSPSSVVLGEAVKQTHTPFVGLDTGSLTRTGPAESNELAREVHSAARAGEVQSCECWLARWVKLPKTASQPGIPAAARRPQGRLGRANRKTRRLIVVLVDLADGYIGKPLDNSFQPALEPLAALHATARQERLRRKLGNGGSRETFAPKAGNTSR